MLAHVKFNRQLSDKLKEKENNDTHQNVVKHHKERYLYEAKPGRENYQSSTNFSILTP